MKWTYDWLKDYLDTNNASADKIAEYLTMSGLEVEEIIQPVQPIVAKIIECDDIPNTHLHLLKVDDGTGILRQVVCGAPNAGKGLVSALARPGCKIGDIEIKVGKIRGHESNGMMCSEKELGLGDNHDGIIELDESKYKVGEPLALDKNADDYIVFDAGITPNRPDYLSVCGIARDLGANDKFVFTDKKIPELEKVDGARCAIIENYDRCQSYNFCEIKNIKMTQSNNTIARRLNMIGITPRNAAIDATNYVCYDMGQPMHCFNADEVVGDIIVRLAKENEKFTDLFGTEHELQSDDLVIADNNGILALAGIIGGSRGMTTDNTKNIILESAYFSPIGIRKTARRLKLSTDSSYRYERGIDPCMTTDALACATDIVMKQCGGEIIGNDLSRGEFKNKVIKYDFKLFAKKIGIDIAPETQQKILKNLGYKFDGENVVVPSWRVDALIPETLVADVARVFGYGNNKFYKVIDVKKNTTKLMTIKHKLLSRGLNEIITYSLTGDDAQKMVSDSAYVKIKNPLGPEFNVMRNSLVTNVLRVVANNDKHKRSNLAVFESGDVFDTDKPLAQHNEVIIVRSGIINNSISAKHGRPADIYDVRDDLLNTLGDDTIVYNDDEPEKWANPYRAGKIMKNEIVVAKFAELHPLVARAFGIKTNVVIGIIKDARNDYTEYDFSDFYVHNDLPEFPMISRDFAFVVKSDSDMNVLHRSISDASGEIVDINIFDVFDLPNNEKSIAAEVIIQPTKNMTDADLMEIQNRIIESVEKTGAKLRA
ncbi:MAG: phenylalanine--tRNA ligase subunit beta [Rickettsiales bacterium]|jgi:phenylalanyl-tRNA synthetase beta chain|nr:phenylalanine--tRNA ligase subunit beta [Rickettsiales bacterium]